MEPKEQPDSAPAIGQRPEKNSGSSKATALLDAAVKLVPAAAVIVAAIIANQFQAANTAANLLNQREQADSALRAGMLSDLITPIAGAGKSIGDMPLDQEQLLVELLALNFHEHFELKPLMLHVDSRLTHEQSAQSDQQPATDARESLHSVARRVTQRQLAQLTTVGNGSPAEQQTCIYTYQLKVAPQKREIPAKAVLPAKPCSDQPIEQFFGDLITISSPNGGYTLAFSIRAPERWQDQTFKALMYLSGKKGEGDRAKTVSAEQDFLLTWFDFPFTDNTLLADGTRFSLILDRVDPVKNQARFKLVWFPRDYFSPRERPTNHLQQREKLGLAPK